MPMSALFAAPGLAERDRLAVDQDCRPITPRSTPNSASSKFALALAVESAEADHLAGADDRAICR